MKSARPDRRLGVGSASGAKAAADAIRSIGVTGDLLPLAQRVRRSEVGPGKRLKDFETEKARLRKAVSDLTLDKLILQEASRGNY
jgi:putative transposase